MSEQDVTTEDGEEKAVHFPDVKLIGGPLARSLELTVDDGLVPKVTKIQIEADVNDVVRMTTYQIVSLADVNLRLGGWEKVYTADVRVWPNIPGDGETLDEPIKVEGKGDSAANALQDAVRQILEIDNA